MKFNVGPPSFSAAPLARPNSPRVRPADKRPMVMFVIAGRTFTPGFFDSWTNFLMAMTDEDRRPFDLGMFRCYTPEIYHCRIYAIGGDPRQGLKQQPWQGRVPYDYIFWLDTDIVFTPEQVYRLFQRMEENPQLDVLTGVYKMQTGVLTTVVAGWDDDFFVQNGHYKLYTPEELETLKTQRPDGLVKAFAAGMGFMIVRKGVYESIDYPWFGPRYHQNHHPYEFASEDISCCANMADKGIEVFVDPDIKLGHEKTRVF